MLRLGDATSPHFLWGKQLCYCPVAKFKIAAEENGDASLNYNLFLNA